MIEVMAAGPGTLGERSLAACLASLLELELGAIPVPGEMPALTAARQWLAERGLGLVAVADPEAFAWAGPWIAQLTGDEGSDRHVIMFGVPSGVIFDPLGFPPDAPSAVQAGYVLASLEPPHPEPTRAPVAGGRVEAIVVAPAAGAPMRRLDEVRAIAGRGLEGDRYADGRGTFSVRGGRGNELTLIAGEVLNALALPDAPPLGCRGTAQRRHARSGPQHPRRPSLPGRRARARRPAPLRTVRASATPDAPRRPPRPRRSRWAARRPAHHGHPANRRRGHPARG